MSQLAPVLSFVILLAAALVGGMIAHRMRQPVVLGYLLVGMVVGPHALSLVHDRQLVEAAVIIGVALLMFTLGLETSFSQFRQVGKVGLWGGIAQIVITAALGTLAGSTLLGLSLAQATLFGLVISMSSTAVCFKILMERGELASMHGQIMVAILIIQDISVAAMVIVTPLLGGTAVNLPTELALASGKVFLAVGIALVLGLWLLPWLMGRVGGVRSRELFLLTVLVLSLGAALSTQVFGLSMVFGAFIIGLVLRESRFAHQALAEITPLRDIFATLFFVSLGMLLDLSVVREHWASVLLMVAIIIAIKVSVVFGIVRLSSYSGKTALLTSAGLFQVGEFGFILAQGGLNTGLISEQFYPQVLGSAVITMLLTPLSMGLTSWLHPKFAPSHNREIPLGGDSAAGLNANPLAAWNRVLIAGYGRIGQNIAQGLHNAGIPYLIIDFDPENIEEAHRSGRPHIYGDASNPRVLSQVDLDKINTLVVTFPDPLAVIGTIQAALEIKPELKVVARVHEAKEAETLRKLGNIELISPEYEASLEFLEKIFAVSGWKESDIEETMPRLQKDREIIEFSREEEI